MDRAAIESFLSPDRAVAEGAALGAVGVLAGRRRAADHRVAAGRSSARAAIPTSARALPARLHAAGETLGLFSTRARTVGGGLARARSPAGRLPRSVGPATIELIGVFESLGLRA